MVDDLSCSSTFLSRLLTSVEEVKEWLASSPLRLNASKTELSWIGAARYVKQCPAGPQQIGGVVINQSATVCNLGVMVNLDLSVKAHVRHVTSVVYFHIRQLRLLRCSLTFDAALALVREMIHTRLDYCNAPLVLLNCLL